MSPVNTRGDSTSTSPSSGSSSIAFSPFTNVFPNGLSNSLPYHSSSANNYSQLPSYSPSYLTNEFRPQSYSYPHMPPPRSPATHLPVSPHRSTRDNYSTPTPHLLRHPRQPRSPVSLASNSNHQAFMSNSRSLVSPAGLSPATSSTFRGAAEPMTLDSSSQPMTGNATSPPLSDTKLLHLIRASDGRLVETDIDAHIDKGFFMADREWTCYRRNYFSVACSYSLRPAIVPGPLYLKRSDSVQSTSRIAAFAMSISAIVDGSEGKPIELVQHTPKRDKGPQGKPDRITLSPNTLGNMSMLPGTGQGSLMESRGTRKHDYDPSYHGHNAPNQTVANFERIQFKSATANNGKRRAAQQYYNLVVELYASVYSGIGNETQWIKVATRTSAAMVVRGRSPGHYQEDRRASASHSSVGDYGGGHTGRHSMNGTFGSATAPRSLADPMSFMGNGGSIFGSGGYSASSGLSSLNPSPPSLDGQHLSSRSSSDAQLDPGLDTLMHSHEAGNGGLEDPSSYHCFNSPMYESDGSHSRSSVQTLPSFVSTSSYRDDRSLGAQAPGQQYDNQYLRPESAVADPNRRAMRDDLSMNLNLPQPSFMRYSAFMNGKDDSRGDFVRPACGRVSGSETSRAHYPDLPTV